MFSLYDKLRCTSAKQILAASIIDKAISACTQRTFKFEDKKLIPFPHYFALKLSSLNIEQDKVVFRTTSAIHLQPADIIQIDKVLESKTSLPPSIQFEEGSRVIIAPEIYQDPQLRISNMSIYNMTSDLIILKPESFLFSIDLNGIDSIMAVPADRNKIVTSSDFDRNVVSHTFLDVHTKLISQVGQIQHHETELKEFRKFNDKTI